jgi:phosphatidylglycerol---prolipoprotein diacylglyceryl transferase
LEIPYNLLQQIFSFGCRLVTLISVRKDFTVHQYLFFIGDFPIRMYGLMLCMAIFMATSVAYFLAWRDGRGWEKLLPDIGIYGGFAGLVGARLWDVFFFDWVTTAITCWKSLSCGRGGMAIQGGILGGVAAGAFYCWRHKVNWIEMLDVICPALFIGQSIGRMANLLNGDAFGAPTGGDFGILYPAGTLARNTYGTQPLWPAEVWEGQIDVILFAVLLLFQTTRPKKGQPCCLYVMLYSVLRFFPGISPGRLCTAHAVGIEKCPGDGAGIVHRRPCAVHMGGVAETEKRFRK